MSEKNWAGYTYPVILRDRIMMAEQNWDLTNHLNRSEVRRMKLRYYLWWKWAPIPAAILGSIVGAIPGVLIAAWLLESS